MGIGIFRPPDRTLEEKIIQRLENLHPLLTPQRLRYPWLIGAALWFGWLVSILPGLLAGGASDRFGQLIGTDFAAFYTAGKIVLEGKSSQLYDAGLAIELQGQIQNQKPGQSTQFNPYLNPPFYALLFVPFALIPYPISPLLWMAFNLACFTAAFWLLGIRKPKSYLLALTWLPAWAVISFGQNTFLSLLILVCVYILWRQKKLFLAGLVLGLLLYKPQLLPGIGFLWVLSWKKNWPALTGLSLSGALLAGVSLLSMPQASLAYPAYLQTLNSRLLFSPDFPIWNANGVQSFWIGLLPGLPDLARILYFIILAGVLLAFVRFWRQHKSEDELLFAGAICLTVCSAPYLMLYDWALLLIPALLFFRALPGQTRLLQVLFAGMWVIMFFSSALAAGLWKSLGFTVQLSVPVLFASLLCLYAAISQDKSNPISI